MKKKNGCFESKNGPTCSRQSLMVIMYDIELCGQQVFMLNLFGSSHSFGSFLPWPSIPSSSHPNGRFIRNTQGSSHWEPYLLYFLTSSHFLETPNIKLTKRVCVQQWSKIWISQIAISLRVKRPKSSNGHNQFWGDILALQEWTISAFIIYLQIF